MAERCFIHQSKIEEFKSWLKEQGWHPIPTKGEYEVLRVWKAGKVVMFYQRLRTDHLSSYGLGTQLSLQFLRDKKRLSQKEVLR